MILLQFNKKKSYYNQELKKSPRYQCCLRSEDQWKFINWFKVKPYHILVTSLKLLVQWKLIFLKLTTWKWYKSDGKFTNPPVTQDWSSFMTKKSSNIRAKMHMPPTPDRWNLNYKLTIISFRPRPQYMYIPVYVLLRRDWAYSDQ